MQFGAECQDLGGDILFNMNVDDSCRCISNWMDLQLHCAPVVYSVTLLLGKTWAKRFWGVPFILKHVHVFVSHLYQNEVCPGVSSIAFKMPHRGLEQNRQMNQKQLFVRKVAPRRALQFLKHCMKHLCWRTDNGEICETIIFIRSTSVQHAVDACVVCIRLHGGPGLTVMNEMQQENSWKGQCPVYNVPLPPTNHSKRMMDMWKPFVFFELQQVCCTGLL